MICDLAETYGIYDMDSLPVQTLATLAAGLGENSRSVRKLSGMKVPINTILLAHIADRLGLLVWQQTKDGRRKRNRPKSFVDLINGDTGNKKFKGDVFASPEDFWKARNAVLGGKR